uniref:D-serine dehydratase n=1 Tax=Petromyzon marinus TaxID=7757 RepID=S4RB37_PETMA
ENNDNMNVNAVVNLSDDRLSFFERMSESRLVSELPSPAFLVNLPTAQRNADRMLERFRQLRVTLRPHMKTHKTLEGGVIMTGGTRRCIAVSTLAEARFFADGGFDDILYAFPVSADKVEQCAILTERLEVFSVLVSEFDTLPRLAARTLAKGKVWHIWLKVDCNNGRAGVFVDQPEAFDLALKIGRNASMKLDGIYAHCGNTYHCHSVAEIQAVAENTTEKILAFCSRWVFATFYLPLYRLAEVGVTTRSSIGSTPSCSLPVPRMGALSEVHPGNYFFYDVQQLHLGSCRVEDVAVRVLTRVVAHIRHRGQLLVDCGWTAISLHGHGRLPSGYAVIQDHPEIRLVEMSQEHGLIDSSEGQEMDFEKFPLGAALFLIPYHSCAAAAMHSVYHVHDGDTVLETWTPCRGW